MKRGKVMNKIKISKIKFIEDMFIDALYCIEKDTVMNLKERQDEFVIYSDSGYVAGRFDYDLKEDIYKYFKEID